MPVSPPQGMMLGVSDFLHPPPSLAPSFHHQQFHPGLEPAALLGFAQTLTALDLLKLQRQLQQNFLFNNLATVGMDNNLGRQLRRSDRDSEEPERDKFGVYQARAPKINHPLMNVDGDNATATGVTQVEEDKFSREVLMANNNNNKSAAKGSFYQVPFDASEVEEEQKMEICSYSLSLQNSRRHCQQETRGVSKDEQDSSDSERSKCGTRDKLDSRWCGEYQMAMKRKSSKVKGGEEEAEDNDKFKSDCEEEEDSDSCEKKDNKMGGRVLVASGGRGDESAVSNGTADDVVGSMDRANRSERIIHPSAAAPSSESDKSAAMLLMACPSNASTGFTIEHLIGRRK